MRKFFSLLILATVLVLGSTPAYAQLCGTGTFSFEFYTFNGQKLGNIKYEIFPVSIDKVEGLSLNPSYSWWQYGIAIHPNQAEKIIDLSSRRKLKKVVCRKNNRMKGKVKKGMLQFKTSETAYYPCLLKLYSKDKEIYILANLIGGCDRTSIVLWGKRPRLAR